MAQTEPLTSAQYTENSGMTCPVCASHDISTGEIQFDGSIGWANVTCDTCKSEWTDQFKLIGYSDLKIKSKEMAEA